MNSPFAHLFLALQAHIAAEVPDIAHIAPDMGQLATKGRPAVSWPCALLDFTEFGFTNLAEHVQVATGIVVVKLGFAPHSPATQATPGIYREKALTYFDIEWALQKALQAWSPDPDVFGSLSRTAAVTQRRTDGYRVREIRYAVSFHDTSTKLQQVYAPASLTVNGNYAVPVT